jgi:hypothetical protein
MLRCAMDLLCDVSLAIELIQRLSSNAFLRIAFALVVPNQSW